MEIKRARENFSKNTPLTITDEALLFIFKRIFSENTFLPQPQCIYIAQQYFKQLLDFSIIAHLPESRWIQADVETFHDIVEREFFEIEHFHSREEFMQKPIVINYSLI